MKYRCIIYWSSTNVWGGGVSESMKRKFFLPTLRYCHPANKPPNCRYEVRHHREIMIYNMRPQIHTSCSQSWDLSLQSSGLIKLLHRKGSARRVVTWRDCIGKREPNSPFSIQWETSQHFSWLQSRTCITYARHQFLAIATFQNIHKLTFARPAVEKSTLLTSHQYKYTWTSPTLPAISPASEHQKNSIISS